MRARHHVQDSSTRFHAGSRVPAGEQAVPAPLGDGDQRFAAYVAHELRTPLAAQRALLELALSDPDTDVASWRQIGGQVLGACRRQERLLAACITLSRSQAGIGACESVDLAVLAAEVLRTTDLEGLTASVRLEHASTTGAPSLIERLLDNLLANAVCHNTVGGWIALTTRSSRSRALVTIENSGPHICVDDVARLFQPFEQLSKSDTGPTTGLGLGLAVVKTIADAHRAQISAHARPAGGLRVEVSFPPVTSR